MQPYSYSRPSRIRFVAFVAIYASDKIATEYKIQKYPTLKLFRHGRAMRREYRGQRSTEAIVEFIKHQFAEPVQMLNSLDDLDNLDVSLCVSYGTSL